MAPGLSHQAAAIPREIVMKSTRHGRHIRAILAGAIAASAALVSAASAAVTVFYVPETFIGTPRRFTTLAALRVRALADDFRPEQSHREHDPPACQPKGTASCS